MLCGPRSGQARHAILRSVPGAHRPERDGLIRIEPAASDRRAKDLHLTKAGEKRFLAGLKRWSAAQARFDAVFGAKRGADLRVLLRAVVASEFAPADRGRALANTR